MPAQLGLGRITPCLALLALVCATTAARAACTDTYPDSQVTQRLAKAEYFACAPEMMRTDYSATLREQVHLLEILRPAYQRRLSKDFSNQELKVRLDEFDTKLKEATALADAIVVVAPAPGPVKGGAVKGNAGDPSLQALLRRGKEDSETLRSRIALAKDGLSNDDQGTYCRLDFFFRIGDGLNARMRKCFK